MKVRMTVRWIGMAAVAVLAAGCDDAAPSWAAPPNAARHYFAAVEGKSFYLFRKGFTCGGPQPGGPTEPSWVDRIEVRDGHLVRWGSRCGGEGLPLPPDERAAVRLSGDHTRLILGDKVYRLSADPLHEAELL